MIFCSIKNKKNCNLFLTLIKLLWNSFVTFTKSGQQVIIVPWYPSILAVPNHICVQDKHFDIVGIKLVKSSVTMSWILLLGHLFGKYFITVILVLPTWFLKIGVTSASCSLFIEFVGNIVVRLRFIGMRGLVIDEMWKCRCVIQFSCTFSVFGGVK